MGKSFNSSLRRGRSRDRSTRRRRPTSLTSASGDDSPSASGRKKQVRSQSDSQNGPIPRISVQAPTPPLLQSNSANSEARHQDQSYRRRQSLNQEAPRAFHDKKEEIHDKGTGKGKTLTKEKGKDCGNEKDHVGRCTHIHHHHYHVHNHYHHYQVHNNVQVGERTNDVEHLIYGAAPFDQSDPQATAKYQEEHYQKHVEQHKDAEQKKQVQPNYQSYDGNNDRNVRDPGPSQQRPPQVARSGSTATRAPAPAQTQTQTQAQASFAPRPGAQPRTSFPRSFSGRSSVRAVPSTHPYRENLRSSGGPTPSSADEEEEEASAIVQANSPRSWTSSPSSTTAGAANNNDSHSTLTTISRGIVFGGRKREELYREDESGCERPKKKGFRAWVSRHLRD
ncbi:hypothetical protein K445DRAFT_378609 [Daldinia sp. EC12]|nr:hypothetical protein K445DRAFT_378609 [Daldinia sp. EC12]